MSIRKVPHRFVSSTSFQACRELDAIGSRYINPALFIRRSTSVRNERASSTIFTTAGSDVTSQLRSLTDGGYEISGMNNSGDYTRINGGITAVNIGDIPNKGRILVNLGSGDDIFNIGSETGVNTTIVDALDIDLGTGANQLNIGRIGFDGRLSYGGEVTITEATTLANGGRGVGNVLIAGAKMQSFDAHMGYGTGERNVTIAGLYYGHASQPPPSDIEDYNSSFTTIRISNPHGMLETLVEDTSGDQMGITTSNGDDRFMFRGVSFEALRVNSFSGRDNIQFERTEFRINSIDWLVASHMVACS